MKILERLQRAHQMGSSDPSDPTRLTTYGEAAKAIIALESALDRTEQNLLLAINGKPVRDLAENLAENRSARSLA